MKEIIKLHTIGIFQEKEYELQDLLNGLLEENERLNNIIKKAIEYIDNSDILDIHHKNRHDLLEILKGSNK